MLTRPRKRMSWPGLTLLTSLTASLWCSAVDAHEVPHGDHAAAESRAGLTVDRPAAPTANATRELINAFRRTGDDRHLDLAWSILKPALADRADDPQLLVEAATVAQSLHRFDTALALVDQALSFARNNDQAWLLSASIHLVRGDVGAAEHACRELRYVPLLVAITCRARVARRESASMNSFW